MLRGVYLTKVVITAGIYQTTAPPIPNSNSEGERKNKAKIGTCAIVGTESPGRLPEAAGADKHSALPLSLMFTVMTFLKEKMAANRSFSCEERAELGIAQLLPAMCGHIRETFCDSFRRSSSEDGCISTFGISKDPGS